MFICHSVSSCFFVHLNHDMSLLIYFPFILSFCLCLSIWSNVSISAHESVSVYITNGLFTRLQVLSMNTCSFMFVCLLIHVSLLVCICLRTTICKPANQLFYPSACICINLPVQPSHFCLLKVLPKSTFFPNNSWTYSLKTIRKVHPIMESTPSY